MARNRDDGCEYKQGRIGIKKIENGIYDDKGSNRIKIFLFNLSFDIYFIGNHSDESFNKHT